MDTVADCPAITLVGLNVAVMPDGAPLTVRATATADPEVTLSDAELAALFALDYHFKTVDRIFARVFGEGPPPKGEVSAKRTEGASA